MLRMKARIRYMVWAGIVSALVLLWSLAGTAVPEAQLLLLGTVLVLVVTVTVLMTVTGIGVLTVMKEVARTVSGTVAAVVGVVVAGTRIWAGSGTGIVVAAGAVAAVLALTVVDAVTAVAVVDVAVIGIWIVGDSGAEE